MISRSQKGIIREEGIRGKQEHMAVVTEGGNHRGREAFQSLVAALQERLSKSRAGHGTWVATPAAAPARHRLLSDCGFPPCAHAWVLPFVLCSDNVIEHRPFLPTHLIYLTYENNANDLLVFLNVVRCSCVTVCKHACACMHARASVQELCWQGRDCNHPLRDLDQ